MSKTVDDFVCLLRPRAKEVVGLESFHLISPLEPSDVEKAAKKKGLKLNKEQKDFLFDKLGAIVHYDVYGTRRIEYFNGTKKIKMAWANIRACAHAFKSVGSS